MLHSTNPRKETQSCDRKYRLGTGLPRACRPSGSIMDLSGPVFWVSTSGSTDYPYILSTYETDDTSLVRGTLVRVVDRARLQNHLHVEIANSPFARSIKSRIGPFSPFFPDQAYRPFTMNTGGPSEPQRGPGRPLKGVGKK